MVKHKFRNVSCLPKKLKESTPMPGKWNQNGNSSSGRHLRPAKKMKQKNFFNFCLFSVI